MALLMFRTFGVIIVSFIVLIMYVLHSQVQKSNRNLRFNV